MECLKLDEGWFPASHVLQCVKIMPLEFKLELYAWWEDFRFHIHLHPSLGHCLDKPKTKILLLLCILFNNTVELAKLTILCLVQNVHGKLWKCGCLIVEERWLGTIELQKLYHESFILVLTKPQVEGFHQTPNFKSVAPRAPVAHRTRAPRPPPRALRWAGSPLEHTSCTDKSWLRKN